jgi:hypothetical protein
MFSPLVRDTIKVPDQKVAADLSREIFVDLAMARHGRSLRGRPVHIHRMIPALAKKLSTIRFQMSDEVPALHSQAIGSNSRMASFP